MVVVMAVGCASATRPSNIAQPDVRAHVAGPVFFGSGTTAPVNVEVTVTNRANVPITVRSIRVTSPMMTEYALRPFNQMVNQSVAPGETKTFPIAATADASQAGLGVTEPLSLRADVGFEAAGKSFREVFTFPNG
jgi:hypothetical protein